MSPLFGKKDDDGADATQPQEDPTLRAEFDRVDALSLQELASEVMTKVFGPGGPAADDDQVTVGGPNENSGIEVTGGALTFVQWQVNYFGKQSPSDALWTRFVRMIAEGFQALEHASLIRAQMHTSQNGLDFTATRLGRKALEQGAVDRLLSGGAL